jgi:hypothetical protein
MAAITMNTAAVSADGNQFLEDVTITDQAAASTAVTKGVVVPSWAKSAYFVIFHDSQAGTAPLFDFVLGRPDWGSAALLLAPTDATDVASLGNAAWNGITQFTATGAFQITVWVSPDQADDDTGSATAACDYVVRATLPPIITYTYTTAGGGASPEDYRFRIAVKWLRS